jgi:hypothetical protein
MKGLVLFSLVSVLVSVVNQILETWQNLPVSMTTRVAKLPWCAHCSPPFKLATYSNWVNALMLLNALHQCADFKVSVTPDSMGI